MPVISMFLNHRHECGRPCSAAHPREMPGHGVFTFDGNLLKGDYRKQRKLVEAWCCMPKSWKPTGSWPSTSAPFRIDPLR